MKQSNVHFFTPKCMALHIAECFNKHIPIMYHDKCSEICSKWIISTWDIVWIQYSSKIIQIEFLISIAWKFKNVLMKHIFRVTFNITRSLTYFSVIITCFTWLLSILTATSVQRFSLIIKYLKIKGKYVFDGRTIEFYNLLHKMGIPRGHVLAF